MFWDSVTAGLSMLGHWETYVAGALYVLLCFSPMLAMAARADDAPDRAGCLTMLAMPIVQVIATVLFVMTLAPLMLGLADHAAWGMPFTLMKASPLHFLGLCGVLLLAAIGLAFVPVLGQMQSLHTLVLGGIVLGSFIGLLRVSLPELDVGPLDHTPPFWLTVGLLVVSAIASAIGVAVAAAVSVSLERPTQGMSQVAMFPLGAVFGFIPVFIYGAWLGQQLEPVSLSRALRPSEHYSPPAEYSPPPLALPTPEPAATPNYVETAPPSPPVDSAPTDPLARAFYVAFGSRDSAVVRQDRQKGFYEEVRYKPGRLLQVGPYTVLVSEGEVIRSGDGSGTYEGAAHAAEGKIALHYLYERGGELEVARQYVPALESGSFGLISEWGLLERSVGPNPALRVEGGGMWQGYTCGWTTVLEIAPNGPVDLVTFPTLFDDEGASYGTDKPVTNIHGNLGAIVPDQSFDVVYSGSKSFTERYVRSGSAYVLEGGGKSQMPDC